MQSTEIPLQEKALEKELSSLPEYVKDLLIGKEDTSIDTSIYTRLNTKYINHNTETINKEDINNNNYLVKSSVRTRGKLPPIYLPKPLDEMTEEEVRDFAMKNL